MNSAQDDSQISQQDKGPRTPQPRQRSRYFIELRCHNCGETGHRRNECPQPQAQEVCSMCGCLDHSVFTCKNSICFKCKLPGHSSADCRSDAPRRGREVACSHCFRSGHGSVDCPFYLYEINQRAGKFARCVVCGEKGHVDCSEQPPKPEVHSCFNCGRSGHTGKVCKFSTVQDKLFELSEFIRAPRFLVHDLALRRPPGGSGSGSHSNGYGSDGETSRRVSKQDDERKTSEKRAKSVGAERKRKADDITEEVGIAKEPEQETFVIGQMAKTKKSKKKAQEPAQQTVAPPAAPQQPTPPVVSTKKEEQPKKKKQKLVQSVPQEIPSEEDDAFSDIEIIDKSDDSDGNSRYQEAAKAADAKLEKILKRMKNKGKDQRKQQRASPADEFPGLEKSVIYQDKSKIKKKAKKPVGGAGR